MSTVKTDIGAKDQAELVPFSPVSTIPRTNVWDAIKYVNDTLTASGILAQYTADAARELALAARGAVAALRTRVASLNAVAWDAREVALRARGETASIMIRLRKNVAALTASIAALSASLTALITLAQYTADEGRELALNSRGEAAKNSTKLRKLDDVQIALKAQVFN